MYPNVNAPFAMGANVNAPYTMGETAPYQPYHYSPVMGYNAPSRCYDSFTLIVVLFILLIIVGAGSFSKS
jgi:uncharacterized protein (TIGR01732 family)